MKWMIKMEGILWLALITHRIFSHAKIKANRKYFEFIDI